MAFFGILRNHNTLKSKKHACSAEQAPYSGKSEHIPVKPKEWKHSENVVNRGVMIDNSDELDIEEILK